MKQVFLGGCDISTACAACIREPIRGLYLHRSLTDSHNVQQNRRPSQLICFFVHQARRRRNDVSYYCRSNTTYCTYWPDCLQARSSSLSGRASQPNTKSERGSFITCIEVPRAQLMHSRRSSWKKARECDVACNALRLAMNSASKQYTLHVHFLCVKVGNASSITELSAIQQARTRCSRRRKDGLHHDGWITPAARCGLNSRALNEVTDHPQYYPSIMSSLQHPILLL